MSSNALEKLQQVFPYGVWSKNGTFRSESWFFTEKPHSMTHWADNYATVGRILIISTSVTETRMKTAVKTPSRKTNNQASFGGSLLKNNMEVEAAMELQLHLDKTSVHRVRTIYV
jgi:hypothetical protein